jgi:hypothetical protein
MEDHNPGKMLLPFKVQRLLDTIIRKRGLDIEDAMQYLYSSDLYRKLSSESSYLWQLSTFNLYDFLKDVFDTLHTQGKEYILEEIDSYIQNRAGK